MNIRNFYFSTTGVLEFNYGTLMLITNTVTNSRKILLDILHHKPKQIGVLDHNIGKLFKRFFGNIDQKLKSAEERIALEKMISEFLIQQTNEQIVVLNTDFTIAEANDAYLKALGK